MAGPGRSRKKLPKAIQRPETAATMAGPDEILQQEAPARPVDRPAEPTAAAPAPAADRVAAEPVAATALPAVVTPAALELADPEAMQRRSQARAIVERHAAYSLAGGLIPLPIANVASVTAIIVRMVMSLSRLYRVPFERDLARAMAIGLIGGVMPTGLGAVAASTLGYIVPGSSLIGLVVSSATSAAFTRRIGSVFVEHFEASASWLDRPAIEAR